MATVYHKHPVRSLESIWAQGNWYVRKPARAPKAKIAKVAKAKAEPRIMAMRPQEATAIAGYLKRHCRPLYGVD